MKWLTISQIKRRSKTAKGALKVSYEHWCQLYDATAKELRAKLKKGSHLFLIFADYCGLCVHHSDKTGMNRNCTYCVFHPYCPRPKGNSLWGNACDALKPWYKKEQGASWHTWKRAAKAVRDKLKKLMDS